MNIAKSLLVKLLVAVALLLQANQSHALTTPYLIQLSNQVAGYHALLSTIPEASKETRALARALRDLSKPSSSIPQDYDRFVIAVLHLGDYAYSDENLTGPGVAVFQQFMNDAGAKIGELSFRTNALNEFVRTRKAASQQIDQALALLIINSTETNLQTGLLRGRRIFSKLAAAEKLVIKGEANQGFAPTVLYVGSTLVHTDRGGTGTITIKVSDEYEDANTEETLAGNYSYERTGLNTGTLILTEFGGGVNTVRVNFRTATTGTYTFRFEQGADTERGAGRFTFTAALPPG